MIAWHHSGSYSLNEAVRDELQNLDTRKIFAGLTIASVFVSILDKEGRAACFGVTPVQAAFEERGSDTQDLILETDQKSSHSQHFFSFFLFLLLLLINLSCAISDRAMWFVDQ